MRSSGASAVIALAAVPASAPGPGVGPGRARRQVDLAAARALVEHRRDQQVRPEHELVLDRSSVGVILGKSKNSGRMGGMPFSWASAHLLHDVRAQPLAQEEQLLEDARRLPRRTTTPRSAPPCSTGYQLSRLAEAVQAEQRAEDAVLEPAHDQLAEVGSSGSPSKKPPMSVVHQGMPLSAMFSPARTCVRSASKVEAMSPDQTAAP